MTKVLIIVPAHNEARFITDVVVSIRALGHDIVVIDDGSSDQTAAFARSAGAIVISTGAKTGKGNALRQGFDYAVKANVDVVITMDGDGQHACADIKTFIACYEKTHAAVINGNRMHNPEGMPALRLVTNKLMSWIISKICHQHIADTQCGFRLMSVEVLRHIKLECENFEIETELLIQAGKKGFRIDNVPVATIYSDEVSKIRPLHDTWRFIKYLLKEFKQK